MVIRKVLQGQTYPTAEPGIFCGYSHREFTELVSRLKSGYYVAAHRYMHPSAPTPQPSSDTTS